MDPKVPKSNTTSPSEPPDHKRNLPPVVEPHCETGEPLKREVTSELMIESEEGPENTKNGTSEYSK